MTDHDKTFTGSTPETYDRYLVPQIFDAYAEDLAERMAALTPEAVLETAAGSGVVTRAAARCLGPSAHYAVTDLNGPMLERARAVQPPDERLSWQAADALALPFDDNIFDVVLCQFGVMFFPEKVAGLAEAHRVLRPGGVFHFNVWTGISENHLADEVTRAVGTLFPDDPPLFLARTPHGHGDAEMLVSAARDAGFRDVQGETVARVSRADSPRDPAVAYVQWTPLRNEMEARDPTRFYEATDVAEVAVRARFGNGPVEGKIEAIVVSAHA